MSIHTEKNPVLSKDEFTELRNRFHEDEANYERLRGDIQTVRRFANVWDTDYTLERYVAATDHIVGLLDGSIEKRDITDPDQPERSTEKPDTVLWLDKSARPVAWFADAFWEQFADKDAEKPDYEYLNIDRVNWFVKQGYSIPDAEGRLGPHDFDINRVAQEDIDGIRAFFTVGDLSEDNWQEQVWNLPTRLDGKNLLIIDEVKNKGGTLSIAAQLLKRAIPEAVVSGDYFWPKETYSMDGKSAEAVDQQMDSAPVWYDKNNSYGRGVGEIYTDYWDQAYEKEPTQDNLRRKLASFALSAPHHDRVTYEKLEDKLAMRLKQDIAYLSYAVAEGKVLHIPHKERPIEQVGDIIDKQGIDFKEYRLYKEARSKNPRSKTS